MGNVVRIVIFTYIYEKKWNFFLISVKHCISSRILESFIFVPTANYPPISCCNSWPPMNICFTSFQNAHLCNPNVVSIPHLNCHQWPVESYMLSQWLQRLRSHHPCHCCIYTSTSFQFRIAKLTMERMVWVPLIDFWMVYITAVLIQGFNNRQVRKALVVIWARYFWKLPETY